MLNEQKLKFIDELRELREARGLTYQQIADETEANGEAVSLAPQVEKKEPMTMTQGDGQASIPMTRFPCRASPNLGAGGASFQRAAENRD